MNGTDLKHTLEQHFQKKQKKIKFKTFSDFMLVTSGSKSSTEIKRKELELVFHSHYSYEGFTFLSFL